MKNETQNLSPRRRRGAGVCEEAWPVSKPKNWLAEQMRLAKKGLKERPAWMKRVSYFDGTKEVGVMSKREQFTRWDKENSPEYDNEKYLEYETVSTGLSTVVISYGVKEKTLEGWRWIPKEEWDQ